MFVDDHMFLYTVNDLIAALSPIIAPPPFEKKK